MSKPVLFVTGASGQLGRRVAELLTAGGHSVLAGSRNGGQKPGTRRCDFDDPASLDAAFEGVERLLLISTDAIGRRTAQHANAINAAKKAGVKHIVYTSLVNPENSPAIFAPEHVTTEKLLKDANLPHTILRNNIYTDMLLLKLPHVAASGVLAGLAGNGGVSYVTREDCAHVAAAALASAGNASATYDVTGPAVVTQSDLAALVAGLAGRPVEYAAVAPETLRKALSPGMAELIVSLEYTISQGKLAVVTDTVKKLTGRVPQDVASFLTARRTQFVPQQRAAQ